MLRQTGFLLGASLKGVHQHPDQAKSLVDLWLAGVSQNKLFLQLTCFEQYLPFQKLRIPLTSSGEILCPESQFIASKLPMWPWGPAGHNAAVRSSSVISLVHWPHFIRFVDSDSRLSGLIGLSVQLFLCIFYPGFNFQAFWWECTFT